MERVRSIAMSVFVPGPLPAGNFLSKRGAYEGFKKLA